MKVKRLAFVFGVVAMVAACGNGSEDAAPTTAAASADESTTTAEAASVATPATAAAAETTTTMAEAVEVSVSLDELSASQQAYLSDVCGFATGELALTDMGVSEFFQVAQNVVSGWTGVPELEAAWLELMDAGADTAALIDAAVPICLGTGWTPGS